MCPTCRSERPRNKMRCDACHEKRVQRAELKRVRGSIKGHVLSFLRALPMRNGAAAFTMGELETAAERAAKGAVTPGSPGRILRDLRKAKLVSYKVVDRSASLYELTFVKGR